MPRRAAIAAALAAASALALAAAAPAQASPAVDLHVAFDHGVRLGATTALQAELRVDPQREHSPLVGVQLLYPESLGILSSGLGLASCRRPAAEFAEIILDDPLRCPRNSVLGTGTAVAQVLLADGEVIPEYALVTVLAGPIVNGTVTLVAYVEGRHPFGARLLYSGALASGVAPFGGALQVQTPPIPSLEGFATIFLLDMKLSIGSPDIRYVARTRHGPVDYHPQGIGLPDRCPRGGFSFHVRLDFEDRHHADAATRVPCPPAQPAARPAG